MKEIYTQEEFLRDYTNALIEYTVPGYPAYEDRLRMDGPGELMGPQDNITLPYDANAPWCPADFYPRHAAEPEGEDRFVDDGGIHPPTEEEEALWASMDIRQDQRGMPVHPFAEAILLGGQTPEGRRVHPGGVVTPGYYYKRGPQKTSDLLLLAEKDEVLHGLFVERKDNGLLAIPGGHVDPEDADTSQALDGRLGEHEVAAIRELAEETGMDIKVEPNGLSCSGLAVALKKIWVGPGADQRATLHSWPQGEAFTAFLPEIPSQQPVASSDAKRVAWLPLSEETLTRLARFSNHGTVGKRAVKAFEEATATLIAPDGTLW
jgi:8-oxo-dGTP pyrophosphatase MutT (NUDIX family)